MQDTLPLRTGRGVQREDVFAAADALLAEGKRPTIERVRLKIGRGSPNTVSPLLEHWFATLGARMAGATGAARDPEARHEPTPGGLPEAVQRAALAFWDTAQREAQARGQGELAAARAELQAHAAALEQAQTDLARREDAFAQTRESLDAALASAHQARDAMEQRLASTAAQAQEAHRALQSQLESLNRQLAEATQRQERMRLEHAQALASREQDARQAEQRHSAEHKRMQGEVDRARQATKGVEAELAKAQQRLQKNEETAAGRLLAEQQRHQAEREASLMDRNTLREQLAASEQTSASVRTDMAVAREQAAAALQRLDDERAAHEATRHLLAETLAVRTVQPPATKPPRGKRAARDS